MTDITELAQSLKAAATNVKETAHIARYLKATIARQTFKELMTPENILALVEALEKAEQYSKERDEENQDLMLTIGRLRVEREGLEAIRAAAEKLVRCKGRYHSEQNYRALAALFGVNTPDLPPLEHENVHYADAAEMEIAALRQRIAELESRTVKLPDDEDGQAYGFGKWANGKLPATAGTMTIAYCEDAWRAAFEVFSSAAGIKVEAE
ncbi:TPA: ead/Ea22-like family protein [Klebsiella pneumoniae]|nr:ead/Ea22-like family protein [Klebsiella pneumoniae]